MVKRKMKNKSHHLFRGQKQTNILEAAKMKLSSHRIELRGSHRRLTNQKQSVQLDGQIGMEMDRQNDQLVQIGHGNNQIGANR